MTRKGKPAPRETDPTYSDPIKVMGTKFVLKIECVDCGAWFAESKESCPFCKTVNLDLFEDRFIVNPKKNRFKKKL